MDIHNRKILHHLIFILSPLIIAVILFLFFYLNIFGSHLYLAKTEFNSLPHWQQDDQSQALHAFKNSCSEILKRNPNLAFGSLAQMGQVRDWQMICIAANKLVHPGQLVAQQFFQHWFQPYRVENNFNPYGLFTGYYLPLLQASFKKSKEYTVPIYALPTDLLRVNLGVFSSEYSGKHIVGQIKQNALLPYPTREDISNGAINQHAKVLLWSNSLLDVFFAQIQGSALIELPNHKQLLISYAGDNGRHYTAIGKVLINNKALTLKTTSMQTIRAWLLQHPTQINAILNQDASYVFFKLVNNQQPLGREGVSLTPQRSLAVDTHYIPLGTPIWLMTQVPQRSPSHSLAPFHQLLIAQDIGGAIKGIVRGDIYWGAGDAAAFTAGNMRSKGQYWVLLPKFIATNKMTSEKRKF